MVESSAILNRYGVAVQAVAPLRPQQRVRLRFELRFPRLRVEAYGHVTWASSTGQCGIRFVDLSKHAARQIDEWIFSNLLESLAREADHPHSIFAASVVSIVRENGGGRKRRAEYCRLRRHPSIRLAAKLQ